MQKRETTINYLDSSSTIKKKSPTSGALLKESMKANLSAAEATAQLKVLCRKFAALTEKVKEETKVREEAEREVRRLKAILDGNNAPVISSCRAESQAYMRDLKAAHDKTKQELRFEKEKNAMLVSKALELEKEKNALLAVAQAAVPMPEATPSRQTKWDKEQAQKIQATLKMTIEELQDELNRKQEELESYKERFQRERSRTKQLEDEVRSREMAERNAERVRKQLETDLREAEQEITREQENAHRVHERAQEDRMIRDSLEEQLETLNEVNAALEQRCNALVRRVELSACVTQDCKDLKMQLRDAEIDNETLVRTIHDIKEQDFLREKELKGAIESAKDETRQVELHVKELEADLISLRAQNSLFSEWMLVRNENALITKKDLRDNGGNAASPHPSTILTATT
uniref:Uncharacterized protein n=1 Tax=Globisporangium ultimum (strain ATCC 200006 / CBS 805.95 / DAOM BR144) TaxID=431595 RepID=K3WE92_GLOUD